MDMRVESQQLGEVCVLVRVFTEVFRADQFKAIRKGSPTLGKWFGAEIAAESRKQIWAPAGFAGGFRTLSDFAEIQYKAPGSITAKLSPAHA